MTNKALFDQISIDTSKMVTHRYSTSFSLGTRLLRKDIRLAIYSIYGFVRFADEIVDTFHEYDKDFLLKKFWEDTYTSLEQGISLNPILHSFQDTVRQYNIDKSLIDTFLRSMEMDLKDIKYDYDTYKEYILGSAEVVGLMCLKVFVNGDEKQYEDLKPHAMSLGSAFQKINFLRDVKADYEDLGRTYFPGVDLRQFDLATKREIEKDIQIDFDHALEGIKQLPGSSRFGVYVAYVYYLNLLNKIKSVDPSKIMKQRIRIPNKKKVALPFESYLRHNLNLF